MKVTEIDKQSIPERALAVRIAEIVRNVARQVLTAVQAHQESHQAGGSDALTGDLDATARVGVRLDSGTTYARRRLNFVSGSGVTIDVTDDSGDEEVEIEISTSSVERTDVYTTSETLTNDHQTVIFKTTTTDLTATLPASPTDGKVIYIGSRRLSGSNKVVIDSNGNNILGATTATVPRDISGAHGLARLQWIAADSEWIYGFVYGN